MKSAAAAGPGPGVVHVGQRLTMRFESDVRFISLFFDHFVPASLHFWT